AQFIDGELGHRVKTVGYNYSDIILTRFYTAFCGGTATEDINYLRDHTLNTLKRFTPPSADTILRAEKELATPCQNIQSQTEEDLIYNFDHQFIPTEKYDATHSYKKKKGYFPAVVSIKDIPLYIEGRNGNCNVKIAELKKTSHPFLDLYADFR
ncbi:MAG: hypothetical protein CSA94_02240, partial [Bacteroidetes bacterium]